MYRSTQRSYKNRIKTSIYDDSNLAKVKKGGNHKVTIQDHLDKGAITERTERSFSL